jgi:hypothetical protein
MRLVCRVKQAEGWRKELRKECDEKKVMKNCRVKKELCI